MITIRGGTTVEVINTDAEGRLVMADALVLATEEPVDAIVDIATLTGACTAGARHADRRRDRQRPGARRPGQRRGRARPTSRCGSCRWTTRYRKELDSDVADIKNLGGANAGAITAALFLAEFVGDVPWAHIDIAGTAQTDAPTRPGRPPGCTGFGARLLLELALDFDGAAPA